MILPEIGPPEAVGSAILAACQSRNTNVKVNASQALGRVAIDPGTLLPVLQRAVDDPEMAVRIAAVSAAGSLAKKDQRALPILLRAIHDKDKMV
jgi:HEAT repeat protein